jgi:hypothetical protein
MRGLLALVVALLVVSPARADFGPFNFVCQDGKKFTITFGDSTAALLIVGSPPEVLQDMRLASGIGYANANHAYREHAGKVDLETLRNGAVASTATCKPAE